MIPRDYVTAWRANAPWVDDAHVEQDLVISRALVEIFSHPLLARSLAFAGKRTIWHARVEQAPCLLASRSPPLVTRRSCVGGSRRSRSSSRCQPPDRAGETSALGSVGRNVCVSGGGRHVGRGPTVKPL